MTTLTQTSIEEALCNEEKQQKAATQFAQSISNGACDISQFVEALGFALTSQTVEVRVNGTSLLSSTLAQLPPDFLNSTQLEFLATFFADRLKDHHNVIPAVIDGISVLMRMQHLPRGSVTKLLQSFFQHTTCQSQVRNDRAKIFRIFKYLSETHREELMLMSGDFLYGLINSIDAERDPRNLDFIFSFMPGFITDFPLLHLSEEMFEIFACYFPIDFNPTNNDPDTITRDALAAKLSNCLVATPAFVEWVVPLALEKLESDLVVAKLDSCVLLQKAALKFPPKVLETYFEQIWTTLKVEIFPGGDNSDIVSEGLKTLGVILDQAGKVPEVSHNHQTVVLGNILSHLSDVNQRLFNPSTAIALICVTADAAYAGPKILNIFLLKLNDADAPPNHEQRIQIYTIVAQSFKLASMRHTLTEIGAEVCTQLHSNVIGALGCIDHLELVHAALSVLNESVPVISEANRVLIYSALMQLIMHESIDLEFTLLLEQLGALYPIEVQSNCIDVCIRNFPIFSKFIKRKVFNNLLPLVKQIAFTQRVLDLILTYVFKGDSKEDVRLLALEALNTLLKQEDSRFIEDLQKNQSLIDKLIKLAQTQQPPIPELEQVAAALSAIVQHLPIAEQYVIVTEYLPELNLQLAADLFVAKGVLGYLHKDIDLDDHFERLLHDLTSLSLQSESPELREVSHHLLCSLVNKSASNTKNESVLNNIIGKLKAEILAGNKKAVEALSWLGKGLIVRGCDNAGEIIEALAALLDHPTLSNAAALAFDILATEYSQLHLPAVKMLYKQKFFQQILSKLGNQLETYSEHHLNAFVYVLKTTPHTVLKMHIQKIGPILYKCLESTEVHTLCIALEICENFVVHKDEYFSDHLNHLIPSCIRLATYKPSMQVRIKSLQLLHDITKYPTFVLLPLKTDVVLDLATALDDPKRLVRNEAVRARNAWYFVGAPTGE